MEFLRKSETGICAFLLKHENDIAKAGMRASSNEWHLLYHAFWEMFNRRPGEPS